MSDGVGARAGYRIAPFGPHHLDEVVAIERRSNPHPWPRRALEHEIQRNPLGWSRVASTLDEPPQVAAYIVTWIVFEHLHVQNLAVHPAHRRRGLARLLLNDAMEEARRRQATTVLLEVRRSNVAAQALYRGLGFHEEDVRRDYYAGPREDAIVFRRELSGEDVLP